MTAPAPLTPQDLDGLEEKAPLVIPPRGPEHCVDDGAWAEFVRQYHGQPRSRPDMSDFALANAVFMASRADLDLIVWQTVAKERIRWLSIQNAALIAAARAGEEMREALEKIAADGEPYRSGYCQTDITVDPALTAEEAQSVARTALSKGAGQ